MRLGNGTDAAAANNVVAESHGTMQPTAATTDHGSIVPSRNARQVGVARRQGMMAKWRSVARNAGKRTSFSQVRALHVLRTAHTFTHVVEHARTARTEAEAVSMQFPKKTRNGTVAAPNRTRSSGRRYSSPRVRRATAEGNSRIASSQVNGCARWPNRWITASNFTARG